MLTSDLLSREATAPLAQHSPSCCCSCICGHHCQLRMSSNVSGVQWARLAKNVEACQDLQWDIRFHDTAGIYMPLTALQLPGHSRRSKMQARKRAWLKGAAHKYAWPALHARCLFAVLLLQLLLVGPCFALL